MADATSLGNLAEATLRLLAECGLPSPLYLESEAELEARCSREAAERQPRGSREAAERQPRGSREAAERQPRGSREAAERSSRVAAEI